MIDSRRDGQDGHRSCHSGHGVWRAYFRGGVWRHGTCAPYRGARLRPVGCFSYHSRDQGERPSEIIAIATRKYSQSSHSSHCVKQVMVALYSSLNVNTQIKLGLGCPSGHSAKIHISSRRSLILIVHEPLSLRHGYCKLQKTYPN